LKQNKHYPWELYWFLLINSINRIPMYTHPKGLRQRY
jgi:hypothetical protein